MTQLAEGVRPIWDLEGTVADAANGLLDGRSEVRLLEAGCGSATQIPLRAAVHTVGIDISADELEKNSSVQEKILGDIQDYPLPEDDFDVIVCWNVLEHLPRPQDALANFFRAVKPGGLLILGFPNLASVKGVVTKLTPFWFHELFYHLMRYTSRHFPTYLRAEILPGRVRRLAQDNGFSVEFCKLVEGAVTRRLRRRLRPVDVGFAALDTVTRLASFGKLPSPLLDNCGMILRKGARSR